MGREPGHHTEISAAAAERAALCALFLHVGAHAPTLCPPWDTSDLAAHLLVRETRIDALAGLVVPPLRGYTAKLEHELHEALAYADVVDRLRNGPGLRTPLGVPGVRARGNLHEFFIHHEDVRRAEPGWRVRALPVEESAQLWDLVRLMAPLLLRGIGSTRITLTTPEGAERSVGRKASEQLVTVSGAPGELLLFLTGRRAVAEVRITGSQAGQARLAAARLGL